MDKDYFFHDVAMALACLPRGTVRESLMHQPGKGGLTAVNGDNYGDGVWHNLAHAILQQ